uniref:Uncharacterized protein n=1 Tax=Panagrolaimus sp. ES5 TaxID=591445 RepID=A0AC34FVR8_9BILA
MKKCLTKRSDDDDRQSSYGSEGSTESSINLDTITEDIDEALEIDHTSFCYDHEVALKLNALAFGEEQILKEQLEVANSTINELQASLTSRDNMSKIQEEYLSTIEKQNQKLHDMQHTCNCLKIKLANSEEHNDLLEFQILELREMSKDGEISTEDRGTETDVYLSDNDAENIFEDIKAFVNMDAATIEKAKNVLKDLRRLACLKTTERDAVKKILQHIENLENKLSFAETELNMSTCEIRRLESMKMDEINELKNQLAEAEAQTSKKKKELKSELEFAKKECSKATKNYLEKEKENNNLAACIKDLQVLLQKNEALTFDEKKRVAELERQLNEIQAKHSQDVNNAQQKEDEKLATINNITTELNAIKKSFSDAVQEKDKLNDKIGQLQNILIDKEKTFEANIQELNANLTNLKETYEKEKNTLVQEMEKTRTELQQSNTSLKTTHDVCDLERKKVAAALKEAAEAKEKYEKEKQNQIIQFEKEKKENERALAEARTEIDALKAQIRPIGSLLERRFEETRYRLQEANKLNEKYEEMLKVANSRISELQSSKEDVYLQEIQQLKIYNHELEEQFASQMEIISALKKKFLLLNNNTDTAENENWTKLTAQPKNSIEDEQYHSEGSSSVGSYSIVRNKV